jgi:ATP-binding cassette subfamily B protein
LHALLRFVRFGKTAGNGSSFSVKYLPRILPYLRPYWKLATASAVLTILSSAGALLSPWPLKVIVDDVLGNHPVRPVLQPIVNGLHGLGGGKLSILAFAVLAGLVIVAAQNLLHVVHSYVTTTFEQKMILDVRSDLFQHAQRLSLAFHDQKRAGQMIYAINYQAHAAVGVLMDAQPLTQSAITLIGMVTIVFRLNRTLALLTLAIVPFLYCSVGYYSTYIRGFLRRVKRMEAASLAIIHEAMGMFRVIVAFARERHEHKRFRRQGEQAVNARIRLTMRETVFGLTINSITAVGHAGVLGYGAYQAYVGRLTTGELLVILSYVTSIYHPLETISNTIGSMQSKFMSLRIAFGILDRVPEIRNVRNATMMERARGEVAFENVNFNYQGRSETLRDICFEAKANEIVAVVGPTGAGKTTLVSLVPRFYDVQSGHVLIDGVDVRQIQLRSLREQISIVLQEPLLFSATIADNIRYGRLNAEMDEIIAAAEAANAHEFITELPQKYDTKLGERGVRISLGERQRISVARAFLKNAPILILDEPTSSVDSRTESVILDALDRLMAGRTTFMIAHRLSTIRHADLILVMQHGAIVQRGKHDELMAVDGLYKQLFEMQTAQRERRSFPPARVTEMAETNP